MARDAVDSKLPLGPVATTTRRAAERLRAGHLWVYRSDVERLTPDPAAAVEPSAGSIATIPPGALVTVADTRGIPLGSALLSTASEIALRLVSPHPALTRTQYLDDLRARAQSALTLRETLVPEAFSETGPQTNACRLLFSEADNLPGIVADRYNEIVILQLLIQGTAQDDVRRVLTDLLSAHPWIHTAVERPDPRIRELEQLPPTPDAPLFTRDPNSPATLQTIFTLNGLRFHFDVASGQKTGAFLDQRLNYAAAARHARGRALDVCTYQGGFALHLA
ncbi:MAG: SAM-dependent methyltransferase, partial [Acidobacteriaceae bacterium]